jgi:hypothetical protein
MRKIILIVSGALAILAIVIGGSWISAYNGAIVREAEVVEARGNVHAALEARYVKVDVLIGAIEDANATIEGYLTIIADAREAFAAAIENGNAPLPMKLRPSLTEPSSLSSPTWKKILIVIIQSVFIPGLSLSSMPQRMLSHS